MVDEGENSRNADHSFQNIKLEDPKVRVDEVISRQIGIQVGLEMMVQELEDTSGRANQKRKRQRDAQPETVKEAVNRQRQTLQPFEACSFQTSIPWVASMARWLECEQHMSSRNAKSILGQVCKLATGKGIAYPKYWPDNVVFYGGRVVTLEYNFDVMMEQAKDYEQAFGEDLGHGWLLRHPIKKLQLFQEYWHRGKKPISSISSLV